MKLRNSLITALLAGAIHANACGPWFPNSLLQNGGRASLVAPRASFEKEIQRLKLVPSSYPAKLSTNSYAVEAAEADLADLKEALVFANSASQADVLQAYQAARAKLLAFSTADESEATSPMELLSEANKPKPALKPKVISADIPAGIPAEFDDYLHGAIAWAQGDTNTAVACWKILLARPAEERHYRSTWAAYMIGKALLDTDPERALKYFKQVRELADKGFSDRLGLAFSSIGWEARAQLNNKRFLEAMHLYLRQASKDPSAVLSLKFAAADALKSDNLIPLASDPEIQPVITAYLASRDWPRTEWDHPVVDTPLARASAPSDAGQSQAEPSETGEPTTESSAMDSNVAALNESPEADKNIYSPVLRWLEAVEAAGIRDMESSERLALTAYQIGEDELAQRWIDRSRQTPTAQWLQAKLLLRNGKVNEAARIMARVVNSFPTDPKILNQQRPSLSKNLTAESPDPVGNQVLGELGALRLARGEYTMALDALLKARFWSDAAYVAERVLSLDELKEYVDNNWPALSKDEVDPWGSGPKIDLVDSSEEANRAASRFNPRPEIRALLGRRLVRSSRGNEALPYFSEKLQGHLKEFLDHLNTAWDENLAKEERAGAFLAAAKQARAYGLRLMATELEPDWAFHGADYDFGVPSIADRTRTNQHPPLVTADEISRAMEHRPDPEKRFHYRYLASDLAWASAILLPDGNEEAARALCLGGTWLKTRDPQEADRFYKALVRRCGKTKMGQLADEIRWFPKIDKDGNLLPDSEQPASYKVRQQQKEEAEKNPVPIDPPTEDTMEATPVPDSPETTPDDPPASE